MERHGNAQLAEPLAQPLAIGIKPLAARQLVANGKYFGTHESKKTGVARLVASRVALDLDIPQAILAFGHRSAQWARFRL
jgi:hypothetical protein